MIRARFELLSSSMSTLVACPQCARHVRSNERRCPFCASALDGSPRDHAASNRAAWALAVSATLLGACEPLCARVAVPGVCESQRARRIEEPPPVDEITHAVPAYGAPLPQVLADAAAPIEQSTPEPSPRIRLAPRYGAPPSPVDDVV